MLDTLADFGETYWDAPPLDVHGLGHNEAMCDVHLVETSRQTCHAKAGTACCYYGAKLAGEAVAIEVHLDDGSPGLHRFVYHEDCAWDMEHDLDEIAENDGCFSYGAATEIIRSPTESPLR